MEQRRKRNTKAEEYCRGVEKVAGTTNITDPVFIAADSITSIEEVKNARKNWIIWYINIPRYERLRQGNFSHGAFFRWEKEDRIYFYKMFLAEITMMRFAHTFVGTGSSNVWQLLCVMRNGVNTLTLDK